jgi:hypothetical protein
MRILPSVVLLTLGAATAAVAQPSLALPPAPASWVAQIVTTGGVLGTGAGQVAISSAGDAECTPPARCRRSIAAASLAALDEAVRAVRTSGWGAPPNTRLCSDCYLTRLTLWTRQADGSIAVGVYEWTPVDAAALPGDVRRVYAELRQSADVSPIPQRAQFR